MPERHAAGAAAVVVALMLVGCGGGSTKSTSSGTATATASKFASMVDTACKPLAARIATLSFPYPDFDAQAPDAATLPKVGRYLRSTNAALGYEALLTKLEAYTAPAGQRADYSAMLAKLRALVAFNDQQADAAIAGDEAAFTASVKRAQGVTDAAHGAARVFGAPACAQL